MNIRKVFFSFFTLVLMLGVTSPMAKADAGDQDTELTFSQPVEIPGQILPAGTYRFVIVDDSASLDMVKIFNADRTKLYATLNTVPTSRREPSDDTVISFAERTSGQPDAIKTWFTLACSMDTSSYMGSRKSVNSPVTPSSSWRQLLLIRPIAESSLEIDIST